MLCRLVHRRSPVRRRPSASPRFRTVGFEVRHRVLHVIEAIEAGVARHVTDIVRYIDAEHVVVLPPERIGGFTDTSAIAAMNGAGAELVFRRMRRSPIEPRNALTALGVRRLVRSVRPTVVHGHASIGGAVARVATVGSPCASVYTPNGLLTSRLSIRVERLLGQVTDRFVAVSESERDLATELVLVDPARIVVIPNGIRLDDPGTPVADLRARLGIDRETPLIGSVGRLSEQKAPEVFVRACRLISDQVREARFVLIGEGPLGPLVRREIARAGLGRRFLHQPGLLGAATVMSQLDAFVLASRYEGGPYVPLEAMRAGTPVVLTDVIGSRDTVVHGASGLLVPPDDPGALADAVMGLLADAELRRRLTAGAQERLRTRFDVRTMARRLLETYDAAGRS